MKHLFQIAKKFVTGGSISDIFWHGSPSGEMRGSFYGLHIGTYEAAKEALEARIGTPAEGTWDGKREYGKTKLAGENTLRRLGVVYPTGYNCCHDFVEDYFPSQRKELPDYSDKSYVSLTAKPIIIPVKIIGEMSNSPYRPMADSKANSTMAAQIKKGTAKRGYYYINVSEDEGSISAVVPSAEHLQILSKEYATNNPS